MPDRRSVPWRQRFTALTQVLVFGALTVVLLGFWGVLKFAPGPTRPATETETATEPPGSYSVAVLQEVPVNETAAEALARHRSEEVRLRKLAPISVAIRKVVGPEISEQKLFQIAMQAIVLCPSEARAPDVLIANGVPSEKVMAVIQAACHAP